MLNSLHLSTEENDSSNTPKLTASEPDSLSQKCVNRIFFQRSQKKDEL